MTSQYKALPYTSLPSNTCLREGLQKNRNKLSHTDPAINVMTDLAYTSSFSISKLANIGQANEKMKYCGVRMLFVTDTGCHIQGLITTADIFGEKPINYIHEHGGNHDDIDVQAIMTPLVELDALHIADVMRASIGDIVNTFDYHGRQHLIVYEENTQQEGFALRGIFSSTHVAKELGIEIDITPKAHSFAEVEQALSV